MASELKRYVNPKVIGPGVWYSLHFLSQDAAVTKNINDFNLAYIYFDRIRNGFPCLKCRDHIAEFCQVDPPEKFKPEIDPNGKIVRQPDFEGFALWIYTLHSAANRNSGSKSEEKYTDVINFFRNKAEVCDSDCGGGGGEAKPSFSYKYQAQKVSGVSKVIFD